MERPILKQAQMQSGSFVLYVVANGLMEPVSHFDTAAAMGQAATTIYQVWALLEPKPNKESECRT